MVFGTPDHWAPKDTFAHITYWIGASAERLATVKRGDRQGSAEDFQPVNERIFERDRLHSWDDLLAAARQASVDQIAAIEALSEADLADTTYPWLEGGPVWRSAAGNGFEHPLEHLAHFYRERGDLARAQQLMEQQTEGIFALDPSEKGRGGLVYNQGCFWALAGQPDRAIALIREALALRPDLIEWSKQDSDLVSLRDLPDFQAIYTATGA